MRNKVKLFVAILAMTVFMLNIASAATVEVVTGKLPTQLSEGDQVDFSIKIKDYEDAEKLTLETNLDPLANKPLWNFGDSESIIDANRYQKKITLNLTSLPPILTISISGKVPEGVQSTKCNDIVLDKIQETKLKYYEIRADEKLAGIGSFDLIVKKRQDFEKALQQIRRKEFDGMKTEVTKLFNMGLATEAQNVANQMGSIRWPDSLKLFGIITIDNDLYINAIVIVLILVSFIIGYATGSKGSEEDEE